MSSMSVTCAYCGGASERRHCCKYCRVAELRENAKFGRRLYLSQIRGEVNEFPAYTSALRSALQVGYALTHRVQPHARAALLILAVLGVSCHHKPRVNVPTPQNTTSGTVAAVGVTPWDFVSPWVCTITQQNLTCMAAQDVRFRRGQLETQITRGYQFYFNAPQGNGTGTIWFGCAGAGDASSNPGNECGPGYFMFGSPSVKVTPVEPARMWNNGQPTLVPYGSLGIIEVDIKDNQFSQIRNRWAGSIAGPLIKPGPGITVACTDLACTVSAK